MSTLCKEGLEFLKETFPDFSETENEEIITLAAIMTGIKHANIEDTKLSSKMKIILEQLNGKQISSMQKDLVLENLMEKELFMTNSGDMTPVAQFSMGLGNEFESTGKEADGQPRVKTIANNYEHNTLSNKVIIDGLNQYAEVKYTQVQTLAHARYAGFIDNNFDEKTSQQQKEISEIINAQPFEIITLSLIAEKNRENQLSSRIQDTEDLRQKLNQISQVKELAEYLTIIDIDKSVEQAKNKAKPDIGLDRTPNGGNSSTRTVTGRE